MALPKYIAWMATGDERGGYISVAVGTLKEVESKAKEIFHSKLWQDLHGSEITLVRITTYGSQKFATAFELRR